MARTLFITGASTGIGAATARAAVAAGWQVGLFARSAETLAALAGDLGAAALALPGDATDLAQLEAGVAATVARFGGLDAAFANAGRGIDRPGTEAGDPAEWRAVIDLNILGLLYTVKAVLPELKRRKGHLLLTGSAAGRRHLKGSVYGATKWFVQGYAGNLAEEMADWGGRLTLLTPGLVDTPFFSTPKPGAIRPEDVASAALFALEAAPSAVMAEIHIRPAP
jgi:NADP-dependent 3-hydroxy acid dehydrogenase YdfG